MKSITEKIIETIIVTLVVFTATTIVGFVVSMFIEGLLHTFGDGCS